MAKRKYSFDAWLESEVAEPPSEPRMYKGMTDAELTSAICRAAIREGHDPAEHGVVPSATVMEEEDSQELAYKNQLKANLVMEFSTHFGVSQRQARRALVATGTIPLGEDATTMEQAIVDTTLANEGVKDAALEQLSTSTGALTVPSDDADLQVFVAFIRKVEHYDTWLRPFAVFMCSLLFAGAAGLSAPTTLVLIAMAYGFTCHDFKPKQKAIEATTTHASATLPPCKRCRGLRGSWRSGGENPNLTHCDGCSAFVRARRSRIPNWARRHSFDSCTDPRCHRCN